MRHPRAGLLKHCQLVVCGVAASGKTTLAAALAQALDWHFVEGDDLHPPANVARMASGIPLDDDDRRPWLASIASQLGDWAAHGCSGVITCSALKRAYRDQLRDAVSVVFVFLDADHALAVDRLAHRRGHFMPAALIDSQFAALERPGAGEPVIVVAATLPVATQVATVLAGLSAR